MAKKRIHEIAKEQGLSNKDVLDKLQAAGLDVTAAASTVEAAAFTSSPAAWSWSSTSLLDRPCSLAISWMRFFAMQSY